MQQTINLNHKQNLAFALTLYHAPTRTSAVLIQYSEKSAETVKPATNLARQTQVQMYPMYPGKRIETKRNESTPSIEKPVNYFS